MAAIVARAAEDRHRPARCDRNIFCRDRTLSAGVDMPFSTLVGTFGEPETGTSTTKCSLKRTAEHVYAALCGTKNEPCEVRPPDRQGLRDGVRHARLRVRRDGEGGELSPSSTTLSTRAPMTRPGTG